MASYLQSCPFPLLPLGKHNPLQSELARALTLSHRDVSADRLLPRPLHQAEAPLRIRRQTIISMLKAGRYYIRSSEHTFSQFTFGLDVLARGMGSLAFDGLYEEGGRGSTQYC